MPFVYDYIVVGAGPAGCICAGELKKKGYTVCVLERQAPDHRKVCGDGISDVCVRLLREIDFPVKAFAQAGAVKIRTYIHYIHGKKYCDNTADSHKVAYGLGRHKTDGVFQAYLKEQLGVDIHYNTKAEEIRSAHQGYEVGGFLGRKIVLAGGASARIRLDGQDFLVPDAARPVGVSAILRAEKTDEPYFMFDYKDEYRGTYGWIFSVGENEYNVGLWLKEDRDSLTVRFREFMDTRVREYLGSDYEIIRRPMGAVMGIGAAGTLRHDDIFVIGDAANTSNPRDGEGISLAVKDALALTSSLPRKDEV